MSPSYGRDGQRTVWFLTSAWLRGQEEMVGHIANRLARNDMFLVGYWLPKTLYPGVKEFVR